MNLTLLNILQGTITEQKNPSLDDKEGFKILDDLDDEGDMLKYIRLFFGYIITTGIDIAEFINRMETQGLGYGDKMFNELVRGMKYVGLEPAKRKGNYIQKISDEDLIYLLCINYIHNGGDNRNFKEGEINLIPGTKWSIDVDSKENIIEMSTIYAEVYGNNQKRAENVVMEDPDNFEVDRETYDHEYTDGVKFDLDITEVNKEEFKLEPRVFNLSGPFPRPTD